MASERTDGPVGRFDTEAARRAFELLWDHLVVDDPAPQADAIVCFGCRDAQVPRRGAELYAASVAPLVVVSGGNAHDGQTEAAWFADALVDLGVPAARIVVEDRAAHTGENVARSMQLLAARGQVPDAIVAVSWALSSLRVRATVAAQHPDVTVTCAPALAAPREVWAPTSRTVRAALGEWDRLETYGRAGLVTPQLADAEVHDAVGLLRELVAPDQLPQVALARDIPAGRTALVAE